MYAQLIKLCYSCQIIVYITLLISLILQINFSSIFLPPANEVWGKVIIFVAPVCHSVHGGGGVVSQYALQVSRPTPRGGGGEVEVSGLGGVSRPTPGGVSQHALRQTPPSRWLLLQAGTHPTGMHSFN